MKRFFAILGCLIIIAAGHAWRSHDGDSKPFTVTIDTDDDKEDGKDEDSDFGKSVRKEVLDEIGKDFDKEVKDFKDGHPPDPPSPPSPPSPQPLFSWNPVAGGSWEPTQNTLDEMQAELQAYVQARAAAQKLSLPEWSSYGFQYRGGQVEGRQVVQVNGHCKPLPADQPKDKFFTVPGEGPCFFRAHYDPQKQAFAGLVFEKKR